MNEPARGKIRCKEYAQQLRDFSGLAWGKITPTDIDAFLDFGDRLFVLIEAKHGASPMPYGQRLALERLCDACCSDSREAVVLVVSHDVPASSGEEIDVANLLVRRYRWHKAWHPVRRPITTRQAIEWFRGKVLDGR